VCGCFFLAGSGRRQFRLFLLCFFLEFLLVLVVRVPRDADELHDVGIGQRSFKITGQFPDPGLCCFRLLCLDLGSSCTAYLFSCRLSSPDALARALVEVIDFLLR